MPSWVGLLDKQHPIRRKIFNAIKDSASGVEKIRHIQFITDEVPKCELVTSGKVSTIDLSTGNARIELMLEPDLFFKVLGEKTGLDIKDESDLLSCITSLADSKKEFDKIKAAYDSVQETGYGIVMPTTDELTLAEPEIIRQGGKYGIRLRASAPSVHLMKTNITTEITPIVGSEQQSEELVMYLLKEFQESPGKIWQSNIFGKSLHELVNEGVHNKLNRMPTDARKKLTETVERIINDGCNGLICLIL